ncbi:PIG-P-domain-containing protein [Aulographum hederae CBS 113979]|uniref:PIG-P-domain-containing protein n=1 Tax=Aulographum hederae CBS 113979 TaxID=1176131 RepID=A0A6G1GLR2_9PEZI|nr:PIG-P-domain-containing protein [Aulographum hederae CBS 113979]
MPPKSRGSLSPTANYIQSKSAPNLPTLNALKITDSSSVPASTTEDPNLSPTLTESASVEDNVPADIFNPSTSSSSSDGEGDDTILTPDPTKKPPPRALYSERASRSYTHLPPSASSSNLFPPFYNRPPTPLPPSPSLTSLLRPSFSTQTSRPTTPDSSDREASESLSHTTSLAGTHTPNNASATALVAKSARNATTVPRASPKVPTYEYYGFALYLASSAAFLMYVLWAYLPSPFLHQLGIYYYPNRWWALAVPAWLVICIGYIYVALASYNTGYLTLPMNSIENLVDDAAQIAVPDGKGKIRRRRPGVHSRNNSGTKFGQDVGFGSGPGELDWRKLWDEGTDAVMDVPIAGVCEILYGEVPMDEQL